MLMLLTVPLIGVFRLYTSVPAPTATIAIATVGFVISARLMVFASTTITLYIVLFVRFVIVPVSDAGILYSLLSPVVKPCAVIVILLPLISAFVKKDLLPAMLERG